MSQDAIQRDVVIQVTTDGIDEEVFLDPFAYADTETWGVLLASLARHIGLAIEQSSEGNITQKEATVQVMSAFNAELYAPSRKDEGQAGLGSQIFKSVLAPLGLADGQMMWSEKASDAETSSELPQDIAARLDISVETLLGQVPEEEKSAIAETIADFAGYIIRECFTEDDEEGLPEDERTVQFLTRVTLMDHFLVLAMDKTWESAQDVEEEAEEQPELSDDTAMAS